VTNEKAHLVDAVHYFPFGEVWLEERPESLPTDYFFTAKELDTETGFYYFGARYHDPRFSKWMTADPADRISASAAIIALNPYQYGRHNPTRFFDPTGAAELTREQMDQMTHWPAVPAPNPLAPVLNWLNTPLKNSNGEVITRRILDPNSCVACGAPPDPEGFGYPAEAWEGMTYIDVPVTRGFVLGLGLDIAAIIPPARVLKGAAIGAEVMERGVLTAAREGVPLTGVARFDAPAVASEHFEQFIRGVEQRGFKVRESPSMTRAEPAFIRPDQRRFFYSSKYMTYLDMRHEIRHFQQLRQSGSLRTGRGQLQRYEREVYEYERSLGERYGFSKEYMEYLNQRIQSYGGR
jgi:RHS repeat-associated protein